MNGARYLAAMIEKLKVRNFKTVRELDLPCKRYNLFIGDTNSGKTNILEALSLVSQNTYRSSEEGIDRRMVRYGQLNDLFPGRDVSAELEVETGILNARLGPEHDRFVLQLEDANAHHSTWRYLASGNQMGSPSGQLPLSNIRRYLYDPNVVFRFGSHAHLAPPDGANLASLLITNTLLAEEVSEILASKDLAFDVNPDTYVISLRHERAKRIVVQLPFNSLSETIKRYLFLYVAVRTNRDAVLLLDEPEQNTFPFYTKHIAELMAREPSNQYFITTHNQYLLQSIIEKAPENEVQVIATYRKEGATHTRVVPLPELRELMEYDLFLNLDRIVEA